MNVADTLALQVEFYRLHLAEAPHDIQVIEGLRILQRAWQHIARRRGPAASDARSMLRSAILRVARGDVKDVFTRKASYITATSFCPL